VYSLWTEINPVAGHSGGSQYLLRMRAEKGSLATQMCKSTSKTLMTMHPFSHKEFILEMLQKMAQQVSNIKYYNMEL
jgi:hypothetical protein